MKRWEVFVDSLNTPGGHILVGLLILTAAVVLMLWTSLDYAETIAGSALTIITMAMRGWKSLIETKNGHGKPEEKST